MLLLLALASNVAWHAPAEALNADTGACEVEIDVSSPTAVPRTPPVSRTWTLDGEGTCEIVDSNAVAHTLAVEVSGSLNQLLDQNTVTCGVALLDGSVRLRLDPHGTPRNVDFTAVVEVVGSVVTLQGFRLATVVATGVFKQELADTQDCLVGGSITSATWCGTLVFADPEV